jgi:hypothetical protein
MLSHLANQVLKKKEKRHGLFDAMNLSPRKQDKISKILFLENLFVLLKIIFLRKEHRHPPSHLDSPPPPQVPPKNLSFSLLKIDLIDCSYPLLMLSSQETFQHFSSAATSWTLCDVGGRAVHSSQEACVWELARQIYRVAERPTDWGTKNPKEFALV